jgi:hypothetical protein
MAGCPTKMKNYLGLERDISPVSADKQHEFIQLAGII